MFTRLLELNRIIEGKRPKGIIGRLNQGLDEAYRHGIAICFNLDTGQYAGLKMVEGNRDVVYMKASSSNGFAPTAVQPLSEDPTSTVNKLRRAVDALSTAKSGIKPMLQKITANFDEEIILEDVRQKLKEISPSVDARAYLFVASTKNDTIYPLYCEQEVKEYMVRNALDQYGKAETVEVIENGRTCYVCGETSKKVYGNFSRLKSYNLDKRGVITGGFSYSQTLKNFPVCEECITAVSSAYGFAKRKLRFPLCGDRYILLPNLQTKDDELAEIIVHRLQERGDTFAGNALEKITASENEILEELADVGRGQDLLTLTLVFFEESNASWKITAEIPEVLPSRITEIYAAKRAVEANAYFRIGNKPFYYTLKNLQKFTGSNNKSSRNKFIGYIAAIFSGGVLEEKAVLTDLVRTILFASKTAPQYLSFTVRDAFATWLFLNELDALRKRGERMTVELTTEGAYGKFIQEHYDFFDAKEKVVAFLTGCYISKVLYAQGTNLGNSPFFKKLRGLKIDRKRLQTLYPEARNKIQQYDAFGLVKDIDSLLAQSWVNCGNKWDISDDEATFAFTLGLSLDYVINNQS